MANKIVLSRIEVADLIRPTTQMAPLFADGTTEDSLVIEEFVPAPSGEHKALVSKDSLEGLEVVDLRMSGMVPIDERSVELADELAAVAATVDKPVRPKTADSTQPLSLSEDEVATMSAIARVNDAVISGALPAIEAAPTEVAADITLPNRETATSLGVAPLEPATLVRAPFVIDTPVPRWSPLPRGLHTARPPATNLVEASEVPLEHERTAMIALDPSSGMARSSGPWQALAAVARSLRSVRWWLRRRRTSRVKPLVR
ncbi:MAG: hypothetical protein ABI678_07695 [Kofleriaceae bacterium]